MNNKVKSISFLVVDAFSYSLMSIVVRLLGSGFEPMTQVYLRILLGFLLACVIFRKKVSLQNILSTSIKDKFILLLMGVVGYTFGVYFVTLGALNTQLLNVSVIYSTIAFFAYIYSIFVFKKKFDFRIILLLILSLVGVSFIASRSFAPTFSNFGIGDVYVLLAAMTMAWFSVGRQMLSKKLNNEEITTIVMLIAGIAGVILASIKGESLNLLGFLNVNVVIGFVLGASLNLISNYLESFSFSHLSVALGNQILLIESFFSVVFGYFIYNEVFSFPQLIGGVVILISIYLMNIILGKGSK